MKILKSTWLLLATLFSLTFLVVAIVSCNKTDYVVPVEQQSDNLEAQVAAVVPIPANDELLARIKLSDDVKNYDNSNGELLWDKAQRITYSNNHPIVTVLVPVDDTASMQAFVVNCHKEKEGFISMLISIEMENDPTDPSNAFVSEIKYESIEGQTLLDATFNKDGVLVHAESPSDSTIQERGLKLKCFMKCMKNNFGGSGPLAGPCAAAFNCCKGWVSGWNPCCVTTLGCAVAALGFSSYCIAHCWN